MAKVDFNPRHPNTEREFGEFLHQNLYTQDLNLATATRSRQKKLFKRSVLENKLRKLISINLTPPQKKTAISVVSKENGTFVCFPGL